MKLDQHRPRNATGVRPWWWAIAWGCILASLYLPSLTTRFDFIDDGNLVYPAPSMPFADRVALTWSKVIANYNDLGPFRPVLWAHWEVQADLFAASAVRWRLARLLWTLVAAATFLSLLITLRIRPGVAVFTTALAMWNPWRNEIWRSLTLSEGVAMPYAVTALVCAPRAARDSRPWRWDLAGAACMLAAVGCKNTFAALVPAQALLRVAPDGRDLRAGWRRHGCAVIALSLVLLVPIAHFVIYLLHWHPGQYVVGAPSLAQLGALLRAILGAVSIGFMAPGLLLAGFAVVAAQSADSTERSRTWTDRLGWHEYRGAWLVGLLLMAFGIAVYLPIQGVAGRYSIPAAWGADLWIAALLSTLADGSHSRWRTAAAVALAAGLVAVAVASLGSQDKFAARARVLWQALEFVEHTAPRGTCLAWVAGPDLNIAEGIHFSWHLTGRGRSDLCVQLLDDHEVRQERPEVPHSDQVPTFAISGGHQALDNVRWRQVGEFSTSYWAGTRQQRIVLWAAHDLHDVRFDADVRLATPPISPATAVARATARFAPPVTTATLPRSSIRYSPGDRVRARSPTALHYSSPSQRVQRLGG